MLTIHHIFLLFTDFEFPHNYSEHFVLLENNLPEFVLCHLFPSPLSLGRGCIVCYVEFVIFIFACVGALLCQSGPERARCSQPCTHTETAHTSLSPRSVFASLVMVVRWCVGQLPSQYWWTETRSNSVTSHIILPAVLTEIYSAVCL